MEAIEGLFPETVVKTRLEVVDRQANWKKFLESHQGYKKILNKISREYPSTRSLTIDYRDVEAFGTLGLDLADELLEKPDVTLKDIRGAIREYNLVKTSKSKAAPEINIRIIHLSQKTGIRDIRTTDIGKLIAVEGIIRKVNDVRPRLEIGLFRCQNGHTHIIEQGYGLMDVPDRCPADGCTSRRLDLKPDLSKFIDVQRARIQESPEGLAGGAQPRTIDIDIKDDLADVLNAGDRTIITGILRTHQKMKAGQRDTLFDIYIDCNSIELPEKDLSEITISAEDEDRIRELSADPNIHLKIRDSIAPSIFGCEDIKEAISLQLFGGLGKEMPDGSALRGDIHVLLIGDPGIAKSQFLRYITKISPRAVYTTGQTTSGAGLTATAVKDEFGDGRWTVEAGALVMADMGMAAVDEMEKLPVSAQYALLEAMEQQSVTCTKAGMNVTLRSRCALLGAANPKYGRFDAETPLAEQFNLPAPLLSRFDLIFLSTDVPEKGFDAKLAAHICDSHEYGEAVAQKKIGKPGKTPEAKHIAPPILPKDLRLYIAYSRRTCFPKLTRKAKDAMISFYVKIRGQSGESQNKPVGITARQMEGLIRLAEASARERFSDEITEWDAERAVKIADKCLKQVAYDAASGTYDIDNVVSGMSKAKRDITRDILAVLDEMVKTGPVDEGDLVRNVVSRGYEPHDVDKVLTALKGSGGCLTNPRNNEIRRV